MLNPTIISLAALIISIASFSFALFQFNRNQHIKKLEKINEIMMTAFELRRKSQDFRNLIEVTDDIDSHEEVLTAIDTLSENAPNILNKTKINAEEIYAVEQDLLTANLEFDLLSKQVDKQIRFNKECEKFNRKSKINL